MATFPKLPAELSSLVDIRLTDAACKGAAPLFDPREEGESAGDAEARFHQARNLCRQCLVRARCAEAVLDLPASHRRGVWAGRVYTTTNQGKSTAA